MFDEFQYSNFQSFKFKLYCRAVNNRNFCLFDSLLISIRHIGIMNKSAYLKEWNGRKIYLRLIVAHRIIVHFSGFYVFC